jgi:hypothetical protein
MRDIDGDNMWLSYITEASLSDAFDDPGKNENWLHLANAFLSAAFGKQDKQWALKYAKKMFDDYQADELLDPDFVKNILRKQVGASEEEIEAVTGGGIVQSSKLTGIEETDPERPEEADEIDWRTIDLNRLQQMSPEQLQSGLKELGQLDTAYQMHNFAFTDPEQRKKIDSVRHKMKLIRSLMSGGDSEEKPPSPRPEPRKRPSMGDVQAKKKEFRQDGTFEKLGAQLPDEYKASNAQFGPARSEGDGDLPGSLQSSVVTHYLRTGELPDIVKLIDRLKLTGRI